MISNEKINNGSRRAARRIKETAARVRAARIPEFKGYAERHPQDLSRKKGRAKFADRQNLTVADEFFAGPVVCFASETAARGGLEKMTSSAVDHYNLKSPKNPLPWNLYKGGPAIAEPNFGVFEDPGYQIRNTYARFAGWIRRAADSGPAVPLRRFFRKTLGAGQGSKATHMNLWKVAEVFNSPEAAARKLTRVRYRANQVLENYGISVSNIALAKILEKGGKTGKLAHYAAELTLKSFLESRFGLEVEEKGLRVFFVARGLAAALDESPAVQKWAGARVKAGEFADLRSALAAKYRLTVDQADGVDSLVDPNVGTTRRGIAVNLAFVSTHIRMGQESAKAIFLVRRGDRTYHAEFRDCRNPAREAMRQALAAWGRQDELMADLRKEYRIPQDRSILVYKEDSYDAGNCQSGTESWMVQNGIPPETPFVSVDVVLPRAFEWRVRNVIRVALKKAAAA